MLVNDYQYETITRDPTLVDDLVIDDILILILFSFHLIYRIYGYR